MSLPECAGTLGYAASLTQYATIGTTNLNGRNSTNNYTNTTNGTEIPYPNRESGDGFYAYSSGAIEGANTTVYYIVTNQVQVAMLNTYFTTISGGIGSPNLICMRVNTTSLPEEDGAEDDEAEDDKVSGSVMKGSLGITWAAMLAVVASVAYLM